MRFGVHISIAGKLSDIVSRAKERGCQTIQIFTRNPRGWAKPKEHSLKEIQDFKRLLKENDIYPFIIHLPYLPNIATSDKELSKRTKEVLIEDLKMAELFDSCYVVVHAGSCKEGLDKGIKNASELINSALKEVKNKVKILIENEAGAGNEIGFSIPQLKRIIEKIENKDRIGLCVDLCHLFVAGYDISKKETLDETLKIFDEEGLLNKIYLLHANDTDANLGSRKDRHQDIGKGKIGNLGFESIVNHPLLKDLPVILETPIKTKEDDIRNLNAIRSLLK